MTTTQKPIAFHPNQPMPFSFVRIGLVALIVSLVTACATTEPSKPAPVKSAEPVAQVATPPQRANAQQPASSQSASSLSSSGVSNAGPAAKADAKTFPKAEPSVVISAESASELTGETDLWVRIRKGFKFPDLPTPLVADKEKFYTSKPEYLQRMFVRGNRYLFHIVEEVEKRGMPTELALLPFVESAMNPVALSSAKAAGLWQFIPSTGTAYNLKQNWWIDNRRDVVYSTKAALDYLQKIYAMHGNDWFLALASYNWGEGAVGRAVKKNTAVGRPTDYLSLDMPNETRHYIPKLIAIKNIIANSQAMGIALPELPNRPYFVTIEKTRPIDLKLAAQFAKMTVDEFIALNPAHNRPVIAASKNNEIKLPTDRLPDFIAAVEAHSEAQKTFASWQPHTMLPSESLESLASKGNVTVVELRKANGLQPTSKIIAGTRLLVPQKSVADETKVEQFVAPRVYEQVDRAATYHRVGKKETLASIASRYGVSIASLQSWNGVKNAKNGASLVVKPASTQTLLTTESGEKSVVNNFVKTTFKPLEVTSDSADKRPAEKVKVAAKDPVKPKTILVAKAKGSSTHSTSSKTAARLTAATQAKSRAAAPSATLGKTKAKTTSKMASSRPR